jgi:hypothetical protein
MSEFSVVTSEIEGMSGRLGVISQDAADLCGAAGQHASAAAQTGADGALNELMGRWAVALPRFGLSGDRLQAAMRGAATAYATTDAGIGDAATADATGG